MKEGKNLFSREKNFFPSPTPPSLLKKSEISSCNTRNGIPAIRRRREMFPSQLFSQNETFTEPEIFVGAGMMCIPATLSQSASHESSSGSVGSPQQLKSIMMISCLEVIYISITTSGAGSRQLIRDTSSSASRQYFFCTPSKRRK